MPDARFFLWAAFFVLSELFSRFRHDEGRNLSRGEGEGAHAARAGRARPRARTRQTTGEPTD